MPYQNKLLFITVFLIFSSYISPSCADKKKINPVKLYCAGTISTITHLAGNIKLAEAIAEVSNNKYSCILPQDLPLQSSKIIELKKNNAKSHHLSKAIRDIDIKAIFQADGVLVNMDGKSPSSGAVVEFMINRCLDKPAVLFKTDAYHDKFDDKKNYNQFSNHGPWSIMVSHYPKTSAVVINASDLYKDLHTTKNEQKNTKIDDDKFLVRSVASKIVQALDTLNFTHTTPDNQYSWCASVFGITNY